MPGTTTIGPAALQSRSIVHRLFRKIGAAALPLALLAACSTPTPKLAANHISTESALNNSHLQAEPAIDEPVEVKAERKRSGGRTLRLAR